MNVLAWLICTFFIAVVAFVVAFIAQFSENHKLTNPTIVAKNGFANSTGPNLTISLSPELTTLVKGNGSGLTSATPNDITSQLLTGYVAARQSQSITSTNTILSGIAQLDKNVEYYQSEIDQVQDQTRSIAPAGQRDLWQYGSNAAGSSLHVSSSRDKIYTFGIFASVHYSSDGGVTHNPCVFDIAPTHILTIGSNSVIVVGMTSIGEIYTSTDGINFIKQPNSPVTIKSSYNILWDSRLSLFIAGGFVNAAQNVITSSDGVTWTPRDASLPVAVFSSGDDIIVASSQTSPFFMWSHDAITWTSTLSTGLLGTRSVAFSAEKQEFLASSLSAGILYRSTDGKLWSSTGFTSAQAAGNSLMWVGGNINQWYLASIYNGNYSLHTTPDTTLPFVSTNLDGALPNTLQYTIGYDPIRLRFMTCGNTTPYFAYSTPRSYDIKPITDNIRVRNNPVHVNLYSTYADIKCDSTTTETDISTTASALGSLSLAPILPVGMTISSKLYLTVTSIAGDVLTIRFKKLNTTFLTHTITVPANAVNEPVVIITDIVIRSTTMEINSRLMLASGTTFITSNTALVRTVLNTFSITATWNLAVNQCRVSSLVFDSGFRNGN